MFKLSIAVWFVGGAAIALSAARGPELARAASAPAMSEAYWRCPSIGPYVFETSGSAVHCKKPAWEEHKTFIPCLVPTPDLKQDLVGTTDMCAGGVGVAAVTVEPQCAPYDVAAGFSKRHVAGRDYCGKLHPPEIIAPNQQITM